MRKILLQFIYSFILFTSVSSIANAQLLAPRELSYERTWADAILLSWQSPNSDQAYPLYDLMQWVPQTYFQTPTAQDCMISDGKYLYSSYYQNSPGILNKYDMEGNFLEQIYIEGAPAFYKMTTDGEYFYGIIYQQAGIYKFDIESKKLISIIPTPVNALLHICYIPDLNNGKGGFEAGNPAQGYYLDMDGNYLGLGPYYSEFIAGSSTAYYDGKLYAYCQIEGSTKGIVEFDLKTTKPTGKVFNLGDFTGVVPGFVAGYALDITFFEYPVGTRKAAIFSTFSNTQTSGTMCNIFKIGEREEVDNLKGYEIYKNNVKQNSQTIQKSQYTYSFDNLEEETDYNFTLKAVYTNNQTSDFSSPLLVRLSDTKSLPFSEDFSSGSFAENYWRLSNTSSPAWSVIETNGSLGSYLPTLRYNYRYSLDYNQTLISKKLKAGSQQTLLKYNIACENRDLTNEKFCVDLLIDGTWQTVAEENSASLQEWSLKEYDITSYVGGKEFQMRFRVTGDGTSTVYNWYIDNIRIWNPIYVSISGKAQVIDQSLEGAIIILEKSDDINTVYTTQTDANGSFAFSNIEKGSYLLSVIKGEEILYKVEEYVIENNASDVLITVPGARIQINTSPVQITMGENKITTQSKEIINEGNATLEWSSHIKYSAFGTTNQIGLSNIETTPIWKIDHTAQLESTTEFGLVFHQGYLYSVYNHDIITSTITLNKYTKEGEYLEKHTINTPKYFTGDIVSDGTTLYQAGVSPYCLYPIDLENGTVIESQAITLDIDRIHYVEYDPVSDGFYAGSEHEFFLFNREGKVQERYDITSAFCRKIALDTFSKDGPYMWLFCNSYAGIQGNCRIIQYSLKEKKYTTISKAITDLSEYSNSDLTEPQGIFSSTEIVPGYFTLVGAASRTSDNKPLLFVYSLFPYENWISLNRNEGTVSSGTSDNYSFTFNSSDLKEGEEREATLIIESNSSDEKIEIPVKLMVDNSMEAGSLPPTNLAAKLTTDYKVTLTWDLPEGTNPMKGYNIFREGKQMNDEPVTQKTYTDNYPGMGLQTYTVTVAYETGIDSYHSEAAEIFVSDPSVVKSASDLTTSIINRRHVELNWKTPGYGNGIFDDFESYSPFIIENMGEWTLYDLDKSWTYGLSTSSYYNKGNQMAFMVFNPSACSPSEEIETYDGKKQMLACFNTNVEGLANNDWIVSPLLEFERTFTFSFMAKTHLLKYGYEKINVGYSLTDNNPESFIFFNGNTPIEVPNLWTNYSYEIPANAKYVTINCVTKEGFLLFIDDIYVGHEEYYSELEGYNIYRDGEKVNTSLLSLNSYTDYSLKDGEYTYEVEAVFANGTTSKAISDKIIIDSSHDITPPRSLQANMENADEITLSWIPPLWSDQLEIRYDDGIPYNSVGGVVEEQLSAIRLEGNDLKAYEGYSITAVQFHIAEEVLYVVPFLFINGNLSEDVIEIYEVEAGRYMTYTFNNAVKIDPKNDYFIGYACLTSSTDFYPKSHDRGPGTPGKSDLVSLDGKNWHSSYELSGYVESYNFNWNIAAIVELRGEVEETPSLAKSSRWDKNGGTPEMTKIKKRTSEQPIVIASESSDRLLGYNVYRDNQKLNSTPLSEVTYKDTDFQNKVLEYYVTAIYETSGEVSSEHIIVDPNGIATHEIGLKVYPNPAKDRIYVEGEYDFLTLSTLDGKTLFTDSSHGSTEQSIDVSSYTAGVYLLTVQKNHTTSYIKLIIQEK